MQNATMSKYHLVTVELMHGVNKKEVTCVLLPESGHEVIIGINLIKEWKLIELLLGMHKNVRSLEMCYYLARLYHYG